MMICDRCRQGKHHHNRLTSKSAEVARGTAAAGDVAECPYLTPTGDCICRWRGEVDTSVATPVTTLRGVPKPKPSSPRTFRIPDHLYAEGQAAAEFLDVYLSEAVRSGIEDLIAQAKADPGYAEWLAAREQEK